MAGLVWRRNALAVLLFALLSGCSGGNEDLKDFVQRIKQRPGGDIEPLPTFEPYESFTYKPEQLRDPFQPKGNFGEPEETEEKESGEQAESEVAPDKDRPKEPLEQYALDSLSMVGTLSRDGQRWGLVKAPDGTIHRVLPGNYMGQQYGRITAIEPDAIRLVEIVPDREGGWQKRKASLALGD